MGVVSWDWHEREIRVDVRPRPWEAHDRTTKGCEGREAARIPHQPRMLRSTERANGRAESLLLATIITR